MKYEEIEQGEYYTYKNELGKEKKVEAFCGKRTVEIDLSGNKIERYYLIIKDDSGMRTMITSDSKNFSEIQPLKSELPETGLLVSVRGEIAFRTSHNHGYGFTVEGNYVEDKTQTWGFEKHYFDWRPATKEDEKRWEELLTEEAKRRGYKNGNHECLTGMRASDVNDNNYFFTYNSFWIGELNYNNLIMRDGKWADIIEDEKPTQNEIDKVLEHFGSQGFGLYKTKDILEKVNLLEQLKNYKADLILKTVENLDKVIEKLKKEY